MEDEYKDLEEVNKVLIDSLDVGELGSSTAQVQEKVKVKRNRGLKKDIKNLLSVNPVISPKEVFETLKSNSYGGALPISLNTVMSTMSQLKVHGSDLKDNSVVSPSVVSDGQDTSSSL